GQSRLSRALVHRVEERLSGAGGRSHQRQALCLLVGRSHRFLLDLQRPRIALDARGRGKYHAARTALFPWVAAYNGTVDVVYYGTLAASKDDTTACGTPIWRRPPTTALIFVQSKV